MNIGYKNSKLEKTISSHVLLQKQYGMEAAKKIIQRMQELDAARCLTDLPPAARAHPHEPKNKEIFSVDILKHKHSMRLLFVPVGEYDISDYSTITDIQIQEIIKIHS